MKTALVIAGSYYHYLCWLQRRGFEKRYCHYVSEPQHLLGWNPDHARIVLTGDFWNSPAFQSDHFRRMEVWDGFSVTHEPLWGVAGDEQG